MNAHFIIARSPFGFLMPTETNHRNASSVCNNPNWKKVYMLAHTQSTDWLLHYSKLCSLTIQLRPFSSKQWHNQVIQWVFSRYS